MDPTETANRAELLNARQRAIEFALMTPWKDPYTTITFADQLTSFILEGTVPVAPVAATPAPVAPVSTNSTVLTPSTPVKPAVVEEPAA